MNTNHTATTPLVSPQSLQMLSPRIRHVGITCWDYDLVSRTLASHAEGPGSSPSAAEERRGFVITLFSKAALLFLYFSFTILF